MRWGIENMGHCLAAFVLASFALAACTTVQPDAGIIGPPNNWQLQAQAAAAHADCVAALDVIERAESSYSVLSFGVRAEFLETGTCLPQDTQKAANQYRKLAETNLDARAAARLGAMYLEGNGVPRDAVEAKRLFRQAAVILAIFPQEIRREIAAIYMGERGIPAPLRSELDWLEEIENGDAERQYQEALQFLDVDEPSMEEIMALLWLGQAGDRGFPRAHYELAQEFFTDPDDPENREALHFLGQAAAAGYSLAQKEVGKRYAQGEGHRQSDFDAAVWLTRAGADGEDVEELLAPVRERLSARDLKKAALDAQRSIEPPFVDRSLVFRMAELILRPVCPVGPYSREPLWRKVNVPRVSNCTNVRAREASPRPWSA